MGRRTIPNDVKETALCMSLQGMTDSDIRQITGVSERSLKRFRSTHRKNSAVSAKPPAGVEARLLTAMDVKARQTIFFL
jgi:transposase-like protein